MSKETLGSVLPSEDADLLTEKAKGFTCREVENIIHGKPDDDVSIADVKSVFKLAAHRTNKGQHVFPFSSGTLNLDLEATNCSTSY
jgi:hypothetical protein